MKRNQILLFSAILILSVIFGACTRSASGGPSDTANSQATLPNPVSTQSQLMKDIIAGTQTAMAVPVDATPAEGTEVAADDDDEATTGATAAPKEVEATPIPLPTSTTGPPPAVELEYNTKKCAPGLYLCVVEYKKDQTVTVQGSYPWLLNDMDLTFKMGPEGLYDFAKYVVVGTSNYKPDASKGYGFRVTLNIPDSLRGSTSIVVLLETDQPSYYGSDFFTNE
ncbi:MAG TPA: hypothetical protein VMW28_05445 [Pelolinea sp.]|nr:hypothetical protein [Pelolinea sp.]